MKRFDVSLRYRDGRYTEYNAGFSDNEADLKASEALRFLNRFKLPFKSILDFGCGGGGFLANFIGTASNASDVLATGIDLNPDAIKYASAHYGGTGIEFVTGSLDVFAGDNKFDLVTCVHVVEHLDDWENHVLHLLNCCKYLYIVVPLEASVWHSIRRGTLRDQYIKYGHVNFFNEAYFLYRLNEIGAHVVGVDYSDEFRAFSSPAAKLIELPRRFVGTFSKRIAANYLGGYCLQVLCTSSTM